MSTQFDTSTASAVRVMDQAGTPAAPGPIVAGSCSGAAANSGAAAAVGGWQPHIAVHTPVYAIQAPRGSSNESQSFIPYSNGSPQAGFHVPASAFSGTSVTSPSSCASAATAPAYSRGFAEDCADGGDAAAPAVAIKIEADSAVAAAGDEIFPHKATLQNGGAPISISQLNSIDCLPFYDQKQQHLMTKTTTANETNNSNGVQRKSLNGQGNGNDDSNNNNNNEIAEDIAASTSGDARRSEPQMHSVLDYDGEKAESIWQASTMPKKQFDANVSNGIGAKHHSESKTNNNNNLAVNNNNNGSNNGNANQFYSLGKSGNRTFFRAPGLEAPDLAQMSSAVDSRIRVCPVCSFSCKSTFHYNSHMNTHGDHQCTMCNYTSRTEGRLRKHMRESHTHAERVRAGLEEDSAASAQALAQPASASSEGHETGTNLAESGTGDSQSECSPPGGGAAISTTAMNSIVNMVNAAAAAASSATATATATASASTAPIMTGAQDLLAFSGESGSAFAPSSYSDALSSFGLAKDSSTRGALDQIKALTERANNPLSALNEILGISTARNETGAAPLGEAAVAERDGAAGPGDHTDDDEEMDAELSQLPALALAGPSAGGGAPSSSAHQSQAGAPARRSGRPKIYRCKQCAYVSTTKEQSWAHNKTHIPLDKQLTCSQCGFVTEYKHHLEYHMRNHKGSKPFKCSKCAYTCVNKSMLNSHMKSHTPVYQYRCKDCTYQTKYCHSLKMHLEKYRHTRMPGTVEMDSDGEEKPISEGDLDEYGGMDVGGGESRGGDESRHADSNQPASVGAVDEHFHHHHQQQQHQQQQSQHSTLNSMLLQPIVSSAASLQHLHSDQIQQYPSLRQLEQVNELLRAANSTTTFACRQCDYVTSSNEELLRHSVAHLFVNQQQQQQQAQQQQTPSLASLYQNLAAVQQQQHGQSDLFVGQQQQQQQQTLSSMLGSTGSDLLNGILQPDSSTKELAAQLQQELLRAQAAAAQQQQQHLHHQQQQQQHQEEESRRQAVVAAMASLANGNLGNGGAAAAGGGSLGSALLGHTTGASTAPSSLDSADLASFAAAAAAAHRAPGSTPVPASATTATSQHRSHSAIFASGSHLAAALATDPSGAASSVAGSMEPPTSAQHFHSSTTTTASSFGGFAADEDELRLTHSLSPVGSSGRRGSIGSASTSGGESTSKTCSVSPGSEAGAGHGPGGTGSRKRKPSKTIKVEQISAKLRDGVNVPKRHLSRERDAGDHRKSNGTASKSSLSECGGLRVRSSTNGSGDESNFSTLLAQLNQQNQMPHSCQHCMIAFRDRALYQIHLGYHGYETPFKCNRCGHLSDSSLEFNLHLYQAKHD